MHHVFFTLAFVLGLVSASAQARDTSCAAIEAMAETVVTLRDTDPADGLARGEAALAQARTLKPACTNGEVMLLAAIGGNLHILGRGREALDHYKQAEALLSANPTPAQVSTVHRGMGVALADMESFESALSHYLIALSASRDANDTLEAAKTAGNIGNLYSTLGQLDRARSYHEQALRDFESVDYKIGIAGTLINLGALAAKFAESAEESGDIEAQQQENQRLRDYNQRAITLFGELGNDRGVAYAASNIALALERLGDASGALDHHERALALRERIGDVYGQINSRTTMASTLTGLGRFDEAQAMLDLADQQLPENNFGLSSAIASQRVNLAEARGDYRDALRWQREITRLNTALSGADHNERISELQERFDNEQQAREIALLRSNAAIRDLELDRQRMLFHVSALIGGLLIVLFAVVYSRLRLGRSTARELQRMAQTDPVTGLSNRRYAVERIDHESQRSQRSGQPFTLLMIDIDRFKMINDLYGHDIGDRVLMDVARRLSSQLRGHDLLARWGGEEFLAVLPATGIMGGCIVAEKLRAAVATFPMAIENLSAPLMVSVTIGLTECRGDRGVDEYVKAADEAMYVGKREGRDRVVALPSDPRIAVMA